VIDIDLIRKDPDRVREALRKRMDSPDLEGILELDARRRELRGGLEALQSRRNQTAKEIGQRRARGGDTADLEAAASGLRGEIAEVEAKVTAAEEALQALLEQLPNMPDDRVPGGGKEANQVVRTWGEKPTPVSRPLDHVELCTRLGLVDYERGTKLGGNGFWLYTGMGAALEWALLDFFCRQHVADGYQFLLPPHLLIDECGYTAGQFPRFRDDVFHLEAGPGERNRFLLPTSETAILNVYRDEIIPFEKLPIKAFAYTPCYRRESGSHRTDERGTIRGHQFNKVEMFQFVAPEGAEAAMDELVRKTESLVQKLGLHHRTSLLSAGDASASMAMTYDVEVWIPSIKQYKEVSSASWARDYQARRAGIRFKRDKSKKSEFVHTLNASGLATSRILPALVEQHQQEDGSLRVPEPLRAWLGTDLIRPPG
jgi:seryl-tRNA synthetase